MILKLSLKLCLSIFIISGFSSTVWCQAETPKPKILFAITEDGSVNLYSCETDGKNKTLLLSDKPELPNQSADQTFFVAPSPQGDQIAYRIFKNGAVTPLYLMNSDGKNKRKIVDQAEGFGWSPDGKKIIYSLLGRDQPREQTFSPFGNEWRILNLRTGKEDVIAVGREGFQTLWKWKRDGNLLFSGGAFHNTWLFTYNLKTKRTKTKKLTLPDEKLYNFVISASPSERRRIISLSSASLNTPTNDIYVLNFNNKLGKRIVQNSWNLSWFGIKWNGDDEFFFVKTVGINGGAPVTTQANEYGFYALESIYNYNFKTQREKLIVAGRPNKNYRLQDVIKRQGIIVTGFAPKQSPAYTLEFRTMDGTQPVTIAESDKLIGYLGQLRN